MSGVANFQANICKFSVHPSVGGWNIGKFSVGLNISLMLRYLENIESNQQNNQKQTN